MVLDTLRAFLRGAHEITQLRREVADLALRLDGVEELATTSAGTVRKWLMKETARSKRDLQRLGGAPDLEDAAAAAAPAPPPAAAAAAPPAAAAEHWTPERKAELRQQLVRRQRGG